MSDIQPDEVRVSYTKRNRDTITLEQERGDEQPIRMVIPIAQARGVGLSILRGCGEERVMSELKCAGCEEPCSPEQLDSRGLCVFCRAEEPASETMRLCKVCGAATHTESGVCISCQVEQDRQEQERAEYWRRVEVAAVALHASAWGAWHTEGGSTPHHELSVVEAEALIREIDRRREEREATRQQQYPPTAEGELKRQADFAAERARQQREWDRPGDPSDDE